MTSSIRLAGRAGLLSSLLLWSASVLALAFAMKANNAASTLLRLGAGQERRIELFHTRAVLWGVLFVFLQLAAPLLFAFTLRASYRLRSAVCFALGAGMEMVLNGLGLFGLLVWLRWTVGVH